MDKKKTCFIITPIGDEKDEIRRHIDGVIDNIIKPVMENEYEVNVAHRLFNTGSINKQIIEQIYNSDIVIANLTQTNPNVMYELAFRHTLGLPAITIAVDGTKLPFDVISERTIFYKDDIQGVGEAKEELKKYLSQIDYSNGKTTGPIHDYLDSVELSNLISRHNKSQNQNQNQNSSEALDLIVKRLESIENAIPNISRDIMLELNSSKTYFKESSKEGSLSKEMAVAVLKVVIEHIKHATERLSKAADSNQNLNSEDIVALQNELAYCRWLIEGALALS